MNNRNSASFLNNSNRLNDFHKNNYVVLSEEEDQAESVDSGCVPDDSVSDTHSDQVSPTGASHNQMCNGASNFQFCKSQLSDNKQTAQQSLSKRKREKARLKNADDLQRPSTSSMALGDELKLLNIQLQKLKKKHGNEDQEQVRQMRLNQISQRMKHLKTLNMNLKKKKRQRDLAVPLGADKSTNSSNRVYTKSGGLVFSKFDFSDNSFKTFAEKKKFDLNSTLKQLLTEKEMVTSLTDSGRAREASNVYLSSEWKRAMMKAEGLKVKDDLQKLKKTTGKKKRKHQKSKENWDNRVKKLQQTLKEKQEKRKDNIKSRQDEKKTKKANRRKKKNSGRVPGF